MELPISAAIRFWYLRTSRSNAALSPRCTRRTSSWSRSCPCCVSTTSAIGPVLPGGPAVRLGVMTWGCEGKFRGGIVFHLGPGRACHKPCRPRRGVSSADLTPVEHHLDDNGLPGTLTDHSHDCRA